MSAPRLNRQVVLQSREELPDGAGGYVQSWRILGAMWAEFRPRAGRERAGEAGPVSATSLQITVRGAPIGSSMRPRAGQRFVEGDRIYRIDAVAESDPAARYLLCFAEEEVAA